MEIVFLLCHCTIGEIGYEGGSVKAMSLVIVIPYLTFLLTVVMVGDIGGGIKTMSLVIDIPYLTFLLTVGIIENTDRSI
jgi:hypothetical protein